MSYLGIIFSAIFATNAFLVYGLGLRPAFRSEGSTSISALLSLAVSNLIAAILLWGLRSLILAPLGLEPFDLPLYLILGVQLIRYLARAVEGERESSLSAFSRRMEESAPSSLVFGIALIASRSGFRFLEVIGAVLASVLGYWAALVLLDAVRERLELSDLPASFRGAPALLISAGLMALAFMGLDLTFVRNLVG